MGYFKVRDNKPMSERERIRAVEERAEECEITDIPILPINLRTSTGLVTTEEIRAKLIEIRRELQEINASLKTHRHANCQKER